MKTQAIQKFEYQTVHSAKTAVDGLHQCNQLQKIHTHIYNVSWFSFLSLIDEKKKVTQVV